MTNRFNYKTILITGGTGSWGHELVHQLLERYPDIEQIRIYTRGEHRQVEMARTLHHNPKLKFIIGDIRDKNILNFALHGVNIVFHLAALKHVPVCEDNSWEAILTNIYGTQNVVEAAIAQGVELVIDVSTDKAVEPYNVYGITKAAGEKLMINANFNYTHTNGNKTKFICIRGGNVIGTNGSVIPLFRKQLHDHNRITVTDPEMTRYLMSTRDAIGLIFTAVEHSLGGEVFVMNMPATSLRIIAGTMIRLFGNAKSTMQTIGTRPGEKKHEVLVSVNEAPHARVYSESHYVILPQFHAKRYNDAYDKFPSFPMKHFTSENARQLSEGELCDMLKSETWLWA